MHLCYFVTIQRAIIDLYSWSQMCPAPLTTILWRMHFKVMQPISYTECPRQYFKNNSSKLLVTKPVRGLQNTDTAFFLKTKLFDMNPFCGATDTRFGIWFQCQSGQPFSCLLEAYMYPNIHLWCNICWPLGGQAILFHIPARRDLLWRCCFRVQYQADALPIRPEFSGTTPTINTLFIKFLYSQMYIL